MSLQESCKETIYNYVDEETQLNAALTGEHLEYVQMVIALLRAEYAQQEIDGKTTFTVPDGIAQMLQEECPW